MNTHFAGVLSLDGRRDEPMAMAQATEVVGEQPGEPSLLVACDARIDNRSELATALNVAPSVESSISTPGLIAKAYRKWGERCAERLVGDFAFAIWDPASRRLTCARDHIGIKPFYYYLDEGRVFLFGSDIRSILDRPGLTHRLDEHTLRAYLVPGFEDTASTFYDRVRRLRPAHTLSVEAGVACERRYWSLDPEHECRLRSSAEYAERFAEIFTEAVRCRMDSHDIGALLSGGLDSSSIVGTVSMLLRARNRAKPLPTFSAVFEGNDDADERPFIESVVGHAGTDATFVRCEDLSPIAPDLFDEQPEPFWNPHLMMHRALFGEAGRAGVRVLLDGFGGDSVCCYGFEALTEAAQRWRWLRLGVLSWKLSRNTTYQGPAWKIFLRHARNAWRERKHDRPDAMHDARRAHMAEVTSGIYPFLLEVMHRTAARAGVEMRYPFFDRRLIEFCVALPAKERLRNGWPRAVQRFAMSDRLPAMVAWRRSKGNLGSAFSRSLHRFEGEWLAEWIGGPMSELAGFIDCDSLRAAHEQFTTARGGNEALRVWNAWTAASWLRTSGMVKGAAYG